MLQTFQTMIKEVLGHGSILSDAVGVDGLTYLPSLPLLSNAITAEGLEDKVSPSTPTT